MKIKVRRIAGYGMSYGLWRVECPAPACGYATYSLTHEGAMKLAQRHAVLSGGASADPLRQGGMFTVRDAE